MYNLELSGRFTYLRLTAMTPEFEIWSQANRLIITRLSPLVMVT